MAAAQRSGELLAVRSGEDLLLSSSPPLANQFLKVSVVDYVAHCPYSMGLRRVCGFACGGDHEQLWKGGVARVVYVCWR